MAYVEFIAGSVAGILVFLALQGVDILPVVFFLGLGGALFYLNGVRFSGRKFLAASGTENLQTVSFDDIGGQEVAKKELCEALEFIKNDDLIKTLGIRPLKGILLNGPPGTGKTLLAKAAASLTNSAFLSASGSEFVEMYVGVGAQRVRQLFKQARISAKKLKKSSAVIFIDEMEVVGGTRGQKHGHLEHDQTLNELLVQMDGLTANEEIRILVIGATNRVDMLDQALLRPGRFDRLVKVDLPDKKGRLRILELHTRNKTLSADLSLEDVAKDTFGFSGAHLESVANEAAILAMREDAREITPRHFRGAIEKVMMGEKLDKLPNAGEKYRVAIHEAGHALIGELLLPRSVASVNVASRSNALGYVRQTQEEDMYLHTYGYLKNRIAVALAGSVAEEVMLSSRSTGGANDFKQAADLARQIVYGGMSEMGIVPVEDMPKEKLYSAVADILRVVENETRELVGRYRCELEQITTLLLDKETISGDELRALLQINSTMVCA